MPPQAGFKESLSPQGSALISHCGSLMVLSCSNEVWAFVKPWCFPNYSTWTLLLYQEVLLTKCHQGNQCTQSSSIILAFYIAPVKFIYVFMFACLFVYLAPARL